MRILTLLTLLTLLTGCALFKTPITTSPEVHEGTSAIGSAVVNLTPNIVPGIVTFLVVLILGTVIVKVCKYSQRRGI